MSNDPFGRQPQPVKVTLDGESQDVEYWGRILARRAEFKGDMVQRHSPTAFTIYPRAVND